MVFTQAWPKANDPNVIQLKSAIMLCRGCEMSPMMNPLEMIHNKVAITPAHSSTPIFPILSIFRYSNRVTRMITEPETSFCPVASNGTKYTKYEAKPMAADAATSGA